MQLNSSRNWLWNLVSSLHHQCAFPLLVRSQRKVNKRMITSLKCNVSYLISLSRPRFLKGSSVLNNKRYVRTHGKSAVCRPHARREEGKRVKRDLIFLNGVLLSHITLMKVLLMIVSHVVMCLIQRERHNRVITTRTKGML